MGKIPTGKMPIEERAKQFMPFAALRGFGKVIKKEEKIKTEKPQLSDEEIEELNAVASVLKKGDLVKIKYYDGEFIRESVGAVTEYNPTMRYLKVIKTAISFSDVLKIEFFQEKEKK